MPKVCQNPILFMPLGLALSEKQMSEKQMPQVQVILKKH